MEYKIKPQLIAPCGMDCSLCYAFLREKDRCPGCNIEGEGKPAYCGRCSIRNCPKIRDEGSKFCMETEDCPCARLKQLDKRYRTRYGMSMIDNLAEIHIKGIRAFMGNQKRIWTCKGCGGTVCVHKGSCPDCGRKRA